MKEISNNKSFKKQLNIYGVPEELLKEQNYNLTKEILIKEDNKNINKRFRIIKEGFILTDFFEDDLGPIHLITDRSVVPVPEKVENKYNHWWIRGYCTYDEWCNIDNFENWIRDFKEDYKMIQTEEYDLYLYIVGGIKEGKSLIDIDRIFEWNEKGIYIELYGTDEEGDFLRYTDIIREAMKGNYLHRIMDSELLF